MPDTFQLHQTPRKTVCVLQTHHHILGSEYAPVNIHPNDTGDVALSRLQHMYHLPHKPVLMQQVHGHDIVALDSVPTQHFWQPADACFTRQNNLICTVMTADCLPVLMTDSRAGFVAAVHCGWRSLYRGILIKLLDQVASDHDLIVWFGPAICDRHYQVDAAFKKHYLQAHPNASNAFTEVINGHCQADLKAMARAQLAQQPVKHIHDVGICTYGHKNYDSWRENKTPSRQAAMIWLRPANPPADNQH